MEKNEAQLKEALIKEGVLVYSGGGLLLSEVHWDRAYNYFSTQTNFPANSDLFFAILFRAGKLTLNIQNNYAVFIELPREHHPRAICFGANLYFYHLEDAREYSIKWLQRIRPSDNLFIVHMTVVN